MDTTRISLILAIVAIAIAAVTAYLWYDQTQTIDALTEQVAALEQEIGTSDQPSTGIDARLGSIEDRLDGTDADLLKAVTIISKATQGNQDLVRVNTSAIAALKRNLNPPPDLGNPWDQNEIEELRDDLDDLTECVNNNMGTISYWSTTGGQFYGHFCTTG